jgi:zinc transporter ZupT
MNNDKTKKTVIIIAFVFSALSFVAVLISYAISGNITELYKIALPLLLLVLNVVLYKKMFPKKQD